MSYTPTQLRANLYQLLDEVLDTGVPIEILRKGRIVRLVADESSSKLANLKRRDALLCDPEELVHLDWSHEWNADS